MTGHAALLKHLEIKGIGVPGVNLFASQAAVLPGGAGPFVLFLSYQGPSPVGTHNGGATAYRRPAFQVIVHGSPIIAREKINQIYGVLTLVNTTIEGVRFLSVTPQQEPFELPTDGQGRARWAVNVATMHRGVSA